MPSISGLSSNSFRSRTRSRTTQYASISFDDGPIFDANHEIADLLLTKMNILRIVSTGIALLTFIASLIENSFVLQHKCASFICWRYIMQFYIWSPVFAFLYFLLFSVFFGSDYKLPATATSSTSTSSSFASSPSPSPSSAKRIRRRLQCIRCDLLSCNYCGECFKFCWNTFWESLSCTFIVVFCTFCVWYFGFSWHFILIWMNYQLILRGYDQDSIKLYKFIYFECKHDYKEKLIRCIVIHRYLFDLYEHSHKMIEKKYFKMDEFQQNLKDKIWRIYYDPHRYKSQLKFRSIVSLGYTNHIYVFLLLYYISFYVIYQILPIVTCTEGERVTRNVNLSMLVIWNVLYLLYFLYIWYKFSDPLGVFYQYDAETFQLLHVKDNEEISREIHSIYVNYKTRIESQIHLLQIFGYDLTKIILSYLDDESINYDYTQQLIQYRKLSNQ